MAEPTILGVQRAQRSPARLSSHRLQGRVGGPLGRPGPVALVRAPSSQPRTPLRPRGRTFWAARLPIVGPVAALLDFPAQEGEGLLYTVRL